MKDAKHWLAIVILVLFIVFAVQNLASITVNFLGFEIATRRIVLMVACVLVGFGLGKLVRFRHR